MGRGGFFPPPTRRIKAQKNQNFSKQIFLTLFFKNKIFFLGRNLTVKISFFWRIEKKFKGVGGKKKILKWSPPWGMEKTKEKNFENFFKNFFFLIKSPWDPAPQKKNFSNANQSKKKKINKEKGLGGFLPKKFYPLNIFWWQKPFP